MIDRPDHPERRHEEDANYFAPVMRKLDEYHAEVLRVRESDIKTSEAVAAIGATLEGMIRIDRERKTGQRELCVSHSKQLAELGDLAGKLLNTWNNLKWVGTIAVTILTIAGTVVAGFIIIFKWLKSVHL